MNFLLVCGFVFSVSMSAAEIKYDSPRTFYAGRECVVNLKADGLSGERFSWNLKYSGRTVAAAETSVPASGLVELKFTFPEIKDGVTATAELICASGDEKLVKNIFFFMQNPFAFKKKIFEKMKIGLWSPEGDESAKKLFESLGVVASDVANFADFKGELLVISGIDLGDFSGLEKDLVNICAIGANVLIINPKAGLLPLRTERFTSVIFSRNEKIMDFDKNFDSEKWGDSPPSEKSLNLIPFDSGVGVEVIGNSDSFTFMSVKAGKGKLVICTWDIFGRAEKSPTPVFLLEKLMLESVK